MKNKQFTMILALGAALAVPAFSMHYKVEISGPVIPIQFPPPPEIEFASCTSTSNTIAVGIDNFPDGIRVLCADAGRIGFWTSFVPSSVVGTAGNTFTRRICPSGSTLVGVHHAGTAPPSPLCTVVVPNFFTGAVTRSGLFTTDKALPFIGDFVCPTNEFLQGFRSVDGEPPSPICSTILTEARDADTPLVDVAVRTFSQRAILGRDDSDTFGVDLVNLGSGLVFGTDVRLEFRFNGEAWQILPNNLGVSCTPLRAVIGTRLQTIGARCNVLFPVIPNNSTAGNGGSPSFTLRPLGPDSLRPIPPNPLPIFSVRALLSATIAEQDADDSNDRAAFTVILTTI
jgi:hypothetical protein